MSSRKSRLLIVDDEETLCASVRRMLLREGYQVDTAGSSEDAGRMLDAAVYDLVVSDVVLPGRSGLDLLRELRRSRPRQKAIVMTAHATPEVEREADAVGVCGFLVKPFAHDELKDSVRNALARERC